MKGHHRPSVEDETAERETTLGMVDVRGWKLRQSNGVGPARDDFLIQQLQRSLEVG